MARFSKFTVAAVLGGAGLFLTPAPASAQFYGGFVRFGSPSFGLQPLPSLPALTPLSSFPFGGSGFNYISAPFIGGYGRLGQGPWTPYVGGYAVSMYGLYGGYPGYGSPGGSYSSLDPYQQHYYRAQRSAGMYSSDGAKGQILDSGTYERAPAAGAVARNVGGPDLEVLQKALAASSEAEVASGEALNHILAAVQAREGKGPKSVASAFLAPNLMAEVRFGGTPAGDALNLLRSGGNLQLPAAFDADAMKASKEAIQRDFAAVATPLLAGKPVDQPKVAKLTQTVRDAQQKLGPVTRELPFPEAADARRFMAQMEATLKVLRETGSAALVNPKWTTEGTSVADLTRHMAKHKLQFGRADKGTEDVYLTLHRALSSYLFALDRAQAKK